MSIVHRHFPSMIKLGAVHDDLGVEFCRQSRPGMKLGPLGYGAIVCSPDADRHIVSIGVLAAVELDHNLNIALPKKRNQCLNPGLLTTIFPEFLARCLPYG